MKNNLLDKIKSMPKKELLDFLNKEYKGNSDVLDLFSEDQKEELEGVCSECYHQTHQRRSGDEGVTYCAGCETVEGKTCEMTIVQDLGIVYNWNTGSWMEDTGWIGSEV